MSKSVKAKSGKKLSTTAVIAIAVAVLGCMGTVMAALISGIALYATTRTQIDRPIAFTQTAESQPNQTNPRFQWSGILSIDPQTPCPSVYVPNSLYEGSDKNSWIQNNLFSMYINDELMYGPSLFADKSGTMSLYLLITDIESDGEWVILSRELKVTIQHIDTEPVLAELVYLSGCGGEGFYRDFSVVPLSADYPEYSTPVESDDADYYTLEPGESEMFVLNFQCQATGIYSVSIEIPIQYQGNNQTVIYNRFPGVICPDRLNYSYGSPGEPIGESSFETIMYKTEQYEWNGSGYTQTGP